MKPTNLSSCPLFDQRPSRQPLPLILLGTQETELPLPNYSGAPPQAAPTLILVSPKDRQSGSLLFSRTSGPPTAILPASQTPDPGNRENGG